MKEKKKREEREEGGRGGSCAIFVFNSFSFHTLFVPPNASLMGITFSSVRITEVSCHKQKMLQRTGLASSYWKKAKE